MKPIIVLFIISILSSCSSLKRIGLEDVSAWHYQLQGFNDSNNHKWTLPYLYVIDPDDSKSSPNVLGKILKNGVPVAYLSIGEAESYRNYFKDLDKEIILFENPNWPGNFKVKFWEKSWQRVIFSKAAQLKSLGYRGLYLDIVDSFYEIKPIKKRAIQMKNFILKIRKVVGDDFLIIQQNAPTLYKFLTPEERVEYFNAIDALALEDCFFYGQKDMDNSYNPQSYCLESIDLFNRNKKKIFSVEYLSDKDKINEYFKKTKNIPILPLVTTRALDGSLLIHKN
ncbi:MAG: endo alpha-1,4 polygalactosaminidase [Bacteriovoracaceae bacterium]|nr:endo alpha-1,4 polygalactosaminidase [Bacteriovoracaceae bacterium]